MGFYGPYVSVATRLARAEKAMNKLRKKGRVITPIELNGRTIARTYWGKAWCDHIEAFSDYENRLPRGRRYVRNGSVCHLAISQGQIDAIVSGSELYQVSITIKTLSKTKWQAIKQASAGQIGSLLDLLSGHLSDGVMAVVTAPKTGLFPLSNEISLSCNCFDWAEMCKHVAAVLYGVGARLDDDPSALFSLRGVDHEELIDVSTTVIDDTLTKGGEQRVVDDASLSDLFGIDLAEQAPVVTDVTNKPSAVTKAKNTKASKKQNKKTIDKSAKKKATSKASNKQTIALPRYFSGLNLKKLRSELGLTQKAMASCLSLSVSTISKYEKMGRKKMPLTVLVERKLITLWKKAQ